MLYSILGLALFAAAYSLWGGLSAVAWTDVVQVVLLVIGGLITTVIALQHVAPDGGIISGFKTIYNEVPEKFSMILEKGEILTPNGKDAWWDLPGLAVLIGGMWVANLYYWGFNQYIIQRTLAAKSLRESQNEGLAVNKRSNNNSHINLLSTGLTSRSATTAEDLLLIFQLH